MVVLLVVLVCWAPHASLLLSTALLLTPPPWLLHLSLALLTTYTVLSPLLFAYRSRRVQREVERLVERRRVTQKKFQKMRSFSCPQVLYCLTWYGKIFYFMIWHGM